MFSVLRSLLLIIALLGCGSGVAAVLFAVREEPPRREIANLPPVVKTLAVEAEDVTEWFTGYGSASADRKATIAAELSATVVELVEGVDEGIRVSQGAPLIRLDDREYQHVWDQARALAAADQALIDELSAEGEVLAKLVMTAEQELRVAEDERRRVADLFERELAAKKEFDFANLAYQQSRRTLQGYEMEAAKLGPRKAQFEASREAHEAAARQAELNVRRCVISAPFSGCIEEVAVDVGDRVGPGSPVLRLIDPSRVDIAIQIAASVYDRVSIGAACELTCESRPEVSWHGRVTRLGPSVDERTRTFSAYVGVDNTAQAQPLVPGTFVTARVRGPDYAARILVPRSAIREGGVFVAQNGTARYHAVTVERIINDRVIVRGGLRNGDLVIISHVPQLGEASPVRLSGVSTVSEPVNDGTTAIRSGGAP